MFGSALFYTRTNEHSFIHFRPSLLHIEFIKSTHTSTQKHKRPIIVVMFMQKRKLFYIMKINACVCVTKFGVQNKVFTVIYSNKMGLIVERETEQQSNFANIQEMPETIMSPSQPPLPTIFRTMPMKRFE